MSNRFETRPTAPPAGKYASYQSDPDFIPDLPNPTWPGLQLLEAPRWCSVDLRDGNQALVPQMSLDAKRELLELLVNMQLREIEVGYPISNEVERSFLRAIIEEKLLPDTVTPQVLTLANEAMITQTLELLHGAPQTVVHIYSPVSKAQLRILRKSEDAALREAVEATRAVRQISDRLGIPVILQFSPESFTGAKLLFARDICNAVIDEWNPSNDRPIIINLPATVELATPDVYANQIEWMSKSLKRRDQVVLSVHTHNDMHCGVAASLLAVKAGAQRVEGTLFGYGERAGNFDLIQGAAYFFKNGVDPKIWIGDIPSIRSKVERLTGECVHERHSIGGEYAVTAFSGTHQVFIARGYEACEGQPRFDVPYIPVDPADLKLDSTSIRITAQSGKNGIANTLKSNFGYDIPKSMQEEVAALVKRWCVTRNSEMKPAELGNLIRSTYMEVASPIQLVDFESIQGEITSERRVGATINVSGRNVELTGTGNGPLDAFTTALNTQGFGIESIELLTEHSIGRGADANAVAYIQLQINGHKYWGMGVNSDSHYAQLYAYIAALNNSQRTAPVAE